MKTWQVLAGATAIGLMAGFGGTAMEVMRGSELFFSQQYADMQIQKEQAQEAIKKTGKAWPKAVVLGESDYDFGSMEKYSKLQHVFEVKNEGNAVLTISQGRTTCKCTVSDLKESGFKPGEVARITVEWKAQNAGSNPDFRQTVELVTNDPDNEIVELKVHGFVTETVRVLPEHLTVGNISSNTGTELQFRLFGFRSDNIEILETVFENEAVADRFELGFEPLPSEEVEKEKGASCGLLAKLTVKPGLPPGPINQTIRLRAQADKGATIHLPVEGQVEGDISIARSSEFIPSKGLLKLGALKKGESAKAALILFVKGPHRHETQFSVGSIEPEGYLHVDIGPPQELNGGKTLKYLVTVEVPAGLDPINRMGSELTDYGRIVLESTHPQTKQLLIDVKFAVE